MARKPQRKSASAKRPGRAVSNFCTFTRNKLTLIDRLTVDAHTKSRSKRVKARIAQIALEAAQIRRALDTIDWDARVQRRELAQAQREKAEKPRKNVTREALEEFRVKFAAAHEGRDYGWKSAACKRFGVDRATVNARLRE